MLAGVGDGWEEAVIEPGELVEDPQPRIPEKIVTKTQILNHLGDTMEPTCIDWSAAAGTDKQLG